MINEPDEFGRIAYTEDEERIEAIYEQTEGLETTFAALSERFDGTPLVISQDEKGREVVEVAA